MKNIFIGLLTLSSLTALAATEKDTYKATVYSQVGDVAEFCTVTNGYLFADGYRLSADESFGKIFIFDVPKGTKTIVIRNFSPSIGSQECQNIVIERTDGAIFKASSYSGNTFKIIINH